MQRNKVLEELFRASNSGSKEELPEELKELPFRQTEQGFSFKASPEDLLAATNRSHLISEDYDFDYNPEHIKEVLAEANIRGNDAVCGQTAIAINDVLFDNNGKLIAIINKYLWKNFGKMVGRVVIKYNDDYWDHEGPKSFEEIATKDIEISDVEVFEINKKQIKQYFSDCNTIAITKKLELAQRNVENKKETLVNKKSSIANLYDKSRRLHK